MKDITWRRWKTSFTFHNVSIKTGIDYDGKIRTSKFTFHNVSIKTQKVGKSLATFIKFTFHNVSIKTVKTVNGKEEKTNLHSTMFLLKRHWNGYERYCDHNLHSTMFLLKRSVWKERAEPIQIYIPQCFY